MRALLFVMVALAIGKVITLAYIRQKSASDTIVAAYREQALALCGQQMTVAQPRGVEPIPGRRRPDLQVELIIGKKDLNVRLWQTSHPKWAARYRDPYLIVKSSNNGTGRFCEYDIKRGTAHARLEQSKADT